MRELPHGYRVQEYYARNLRGCLVTEIAVWCGPRLVKSGPIGRVDIGKAVKDDRAILARRTRA